MRRLGMFIFGLAMGGAVGVVLALVFTPASGAKLRKEAQVYYEELLEEARKAAAERRKALEMELRDVTGTAEPEA
jgi:gas vesicle protein